MDREPKREVSNKKGKVVAPKKGIKPESTTLAIPSPATAVNSLSISTCGLKDSRTREGRALTPIQSHIRSRRAFEILTEPTQLERALVMYRQQALSNCEDSRNPPPDVGQFLALRQASHAERIEAVRRITDAITQRAD